MSYSTPVRLADILMELTIWQMMGKTADIRYSGISKLFVTAPRTFIGKGAQPLFSSWGGKMRMARIWYYGYSPS